MEAQKLDCLSFTGLMQKRRTASGRFHLLLVLLLLSFDVTHAAVKGPPIASYLRTKRIVKSGSNVRLACPLSGNPSPMVDWSKDNEAITDYSWIRFIVSKKVLKINKVQPEDTGIYKCKGTNGYGYTTIRIDLIVIDPKDFPTLGKDETPTSAPPVMTQDTLRLRSVYRKKSGDNLRLACEALGKPEPQIEWLKNGQTMSPPDGVRSHLLGGNGRAVLSLKQVEVVDTGLYTCKATNSAGVTTRNFTLDVIPDHNSHNNPSGGAHSKSLVLNNIGVQEPALSMFGPGNTTVDQGSKAVLECKVRSTIQSEIMWLKRLEHAVEIASDKDVIEVGDDKFKILDQNRDGNFVNNIVSNSEKGVEYINKMVIEETTLTDAGRYYCFVKNPLGYKFQGANLAIIPKSTAPFEGGLEPGTLLILVICLVLVVILLTVIITVCIIKKKQKSSAHNTSHATASSVGGSEVPPELTENLMRHQHQQHIIANGNLYMQQQQQLTRNMQMQNHYHQPYHPPSNSLYHQQISNNNRNGNGQMNLIVNKMSDHQLPTAQPPSLHGDWLQAPLYQGETSSGHHSNVGGGGGSSNPYGDSQQNQYEVPHSHEAHRNGAVGGGGGAAVDSYNHHQSAAAAAAGGQQQQPLYGGRVYKMY